MEDHPLDQSGWQRARQDTSSTFKTIWFWLYEVLIGAGLTILVLLWIPPLVKDADGWWLTMMQVLVPLIGVLIGLGVLFLIELAIIAPRKQRNEARHALEKLSQTPLIVECNNYEYSLVGKNWLQENQYIWRFNVILTNNSDTQSVSTKAISLLVNYPTPDGKVKSYALSLVPDTDRDNYGRPSNAHGEPFGENEYLRHREALTGFYQFLDVAAFWKPKFIQTWPTLVIMDSFGAPHRKQFNQSRLASQLNPDKEGSQTE